MDKPRMNAAPTGSRPQALYRQSLLDRLQALAPASVLEVGCGGGGFLRSATNLETQLIGIDPDQESLITLREHGFDVRVGSAEQLKFADTAVDLVVFSYAAHHIADWPAALMEALRVARHAVVILDPWYDDGIASQRIALDFDSWCKAIDRDSGMVHNDCLNAADLLAPLAECLGEFEINVDYQLVLHELGQERLIQMAREQLRKCGHNALRVAELDLIKQAAQRDGFSDDGAILLTIGKPGRTARMDHP